MHGQTSGTANTQRSQKWVALGLLVLLIVGSLVVLKNKTSQDTHVDTNMSFISRDLVASDHNMEVAEDLSCYAGSWRVAIYAFSDGRFLYYVCIHCPPGFKCAGGTAPRQDCLAGSYTDVWRRSSCKQASVGHYVPATRSSYQIACPPGTFSDTTGAASCKPCPAGKYQSQSGQSQCVNCPAGTKQDKLGQTTCEEVCKTPSPVAASSPIAALIKFEYQPMFDSMNSYGCPAIIWYSASRTSSHAQPPSGCYWDDTKVVVTSFVFESYYSFVQYTVNKDGTTACKRAHVPPGSKLLEPNPSDVPCPQVADVDVQPMRSRITVPGTDTASLLSFVESGICPHGVILTSDSGAKYQFYGAVGCGFGGEGKHIITTRIARMFTNGDFRTLVLWFDTNTDVGLYLLGIEPVNRGVVGGGMGCGNNNKCPFNNMVPDLPNKFEFTPSKNMIEWIWG